MLILWILCTYTMDDHFNTVQQFFFQHLYFFRREIHGKSVKKSQRPLQIPSRRVIYLTQFLIEMSLYSSAKNPIFQFFIFLINHFKLKFMTSVNILKFIRFIEKLILKIEPLDALYKIFIILKLFKKLFDFIKKIIQKINYAKSLHMV